MRLVDVRATPALMRMRQENLPPLEKVVLFEQELTRLLREGPDNLTDRYGLWDFPTNFILTVDYDAQNFLAQACKFAGISDKLHMPWKTTMLIRDNVVTITNGDDYGDMVWPVEKKQRGAETSD
jgi:hypothetical protein